MNAGFGFALSKSIAMLLDAEKGRQMPIDLSHLRNKKTVQIP